MNKHSEPRKPYPVRANSSGVHPPGLEPKPIENIGELLPGTKLGRHGEIAPDPDGRLLLERLGGGGPYRTPTLDDL